MEWEKRFAAHISLNELVLKMSKSVDNPKLNVIKADLNILTQFRVPNLGYVQGSCSYYLWVHIL